MGSGWVDLLFRLLLAGSICALSAGLGRLVARPPLGGLSRLAWDTASGLPVLIGVFLIVGQVPGGYGLASLVAIVAIGLIGLTILARLRRPKNTGDVRLSRPGLATSISLALLAAVLLVGMLWDRVPSVFFDTLAYHYAMPAMWLVDGRIAPVTWSLHSWFPPGMSVLYGLGLASVGEPAAADMNLLVGLLLLALAADVARRLWGSPAGPLAAAFLLFLPITLHALAIPAADLGHGMFVFGSLGAGILAWKEKNTAWLRRSSLLAGGALQTKWLGGLVPLALWLVVLLVLDRGKPRRAARFAAVPLVLIAPWLLANLLVVGNPIAPAGSSLLPTRGLAPGGAEAFRADARGGLPLLEDLRLLGPRLVAGDSDADRLYPTPAWGWAPILLLPAGLFLVRTDPWPRRVLGVASATFLVWLLTFRWERFLVGTSALIAVACAGLILGLWRMGGAMRVLPWAVLLLAGLVSLRAALSVLAFTGGEAVFLGRIEARSFIERGFPIRRLYAKAGETLDSKSSDVLFIGEDRHYGLPVPHAAPGPFNVHPLTVALAAGDTPEQASAALRRLGYTHLIVDPAGVARSASKYPSLALFRDRPELLESYVRSLGPPLTSENGIRLFEIPTTAPLTK